MPKRPLVLQIKPKLSESFSGYIDYPVTSNAVKSWSYLICHFLYECRFTLATNGLGLGVVGN